eukprot:15316164-Alexandrium_andersonii.AAC.1
MSSLPGMTDTSRSRAFLKISRHIGWKCWMNFRMCGSMSDANMWSSMSWSSWKMRSSASTCRQT